MNVRNITKMIPFIIVFALVVLLLESIYKPTQSQPQTTYTDQALPKFQLRLVSDNSQFFTPKDMHGKVALLNVWATWCPACAEEHETLMMIASEYHIPIYGIVYKDDANTVKTWLQEYGNPYVMVGNDFDGNVSVDLGIYGTPETFIINKKGQIVFRYVGGIDRETWKNTLYSIILQLYKQP